MLELPKTEIQVPEGKSIATFGTGCFWCTEAVFQKLKGVASVQSGFSGGHLENPSYQQVVTGTTGHAEVVQIVFDPTVIGFTDLLEVFWSSHDPTTLNRQGADVGPQYRSAIFYHSESQKEEAQRYLDSLQKSNLFKDPIVTEITPFSNFYPAAEYHRNYFELNGNQPYCQFVIRPKVEKFKQAFADKLR